MTNEKRYATICEMLRQYDAMANLNFADEVIRRPSEYEDWSARNEELQFYKNGAKLLAECCAAMDREKAGSGRTAALKRIFKDTPTSRPSMRGYVKSGERWALITGCRFVRTEDKINSIPEADTTKGDPFDVDKVVPKDYAERETVHLPSISEIKKHMAANGITASNADMHPFEALPGWWCNPQFLLDMVTIIPGGVAYKPNGYNDGLYYRSETEDALLLPVRHKSA